MPGTVGQSPGKGNLRGQACAARHDGLVDRWATSLLLPRG